ncbi:MFS transporter [Paenibacillus sp. FSL P2-0136]|uniref:MFS transporter n=1 Tax=unclassified Paenibacillus TaxID=185978 RepID=UPI0030DBEE1A
MYKGSPSATRYSVVTAVLVLCSLIVVSGIYVTLPLGSLLADAFEASPARVAWASSAFTFSYALGFLLFAPLSERFGRWPMMFWGLLALGVITPLLGLAPDLSALIALRSLQGLAAATFAPAVMIYVAETFPPERRVAAMGFVSTGFLVSAIAGQLFSSAVSGYWGWSYVFYIHGALCLVAAGLTGAFVPRGKERRTRAGMTALYKQLPALFLQKQLVLCYLICLTILLSFVGMYTIFQNDLTETPFTLTAAQLMQVRAAGLAGMILAPFAGRLAARFGFKRTLQAGLLLAAGGLGAVGLSSTLPVLVIMSIVYIAGISIMIPVLISLIGVLAGERRGPAITLYSLMLFIGASAGPQAALNLIQAGGSLTAFEALAALLLTAFGLSRFIKVPEA